MGMLLLFRGCRHCCYRYRHRSNSQVSPLFIVHKSDDGQREWTKEFLEPSRIVERGQFRSRLVDLVGLMANYLSIDLALVDLVGPFVESVGPLEGLVGESMVQCWICSVHC